MFLKKLTLTHFKCLANIELSFAQSPSENRKWTLILGENGTGKSNLLKAIALVTSGSSALGELLGNTDSWIQLGQSQCTIAAELQTKKGEVRHIALQIHRGDNLANIMANNIDSLRLIDEALNHADRNYFVVAYGASRRLSGDVFSGFDTSRNSRSSNVRNLFDNSTSLNPLAAWAIDLDYRSGEAGLSIIKNALQDFLPGITFHAINKEHKQLLFQTVDGIVALEQLSDGYQNMAAWIGDLLFRVTETFKDFNDPLLARGLLLIDEIDLHLHPRWQRKLLAFIGDKLPNFQVVATTHSPLTAQQADSGELFALKRNADNLVEVVPFNGSPKALLVNQLLMSPVFGLKSDESYAVSQAKVAYQALMLKGDTLGADDSKQLKAVKKTLQLNLPQRDSLATEKELALLAKLEASLNIAE